LLKDRPRPATTSRTQARLAFLDIPLASFGDTVRETPLQRYTPLPGVESHFIANRFTDRYLVYGSLGQYAARPRRQGEPAGLRGAGRFAPRARGRSDVGHTVIRAEQAGGDIVLTGYRDYGGPVRHL
jgi:hypothetical protein